MSLLLIWTIVVLETDVVGGCCSAGIDVLWVVNDGTHGKDVEETRAETVLTEWF